MAQFRRTRIRTVAACAAAAVALTGCSKEQDPQAAAAALNVDGMAGVAATTVTASAPTAPPAPSIEAPELSGAAAAAVEVYEAFLAAATLSMDDRDALKEYAEEQAISGAFTHQRMNESGEVVGKVEFFPSVLSVATLDEGTSALIVDCLTVVSDGSSTTRRYNVVAEKDTAAGWKVSSFSFEGDFMPCVPHDIHEQAGPVGTNLMETFMRLLGPSDDLTPFTELVADSAAHFVAMEAGLLRNQGLIFPAVDYDVDAVPVAWNADLGFATYLLCAQTEGGVQYVAAGDHPDFPAQPVTEEGAPYALGVSLIKDDDGWVAVELSTPDEMGLDAVIDVCFTGQRHTLNFPASSAPAGA